MHAALCSTPICKVNKAMNWRKMPKQPYVFIGSRCIGKCVFRGRYRRSRMMKRTLIISRAGARAASALGRRNNRAPMTRAPSWKRHMPKWMPNIRVRMCRDRRIGRVGASHLCASNSGKTELTACTTGWCSSAPALKQYGRLSVCIRRPINRISCTI